MRKDQAVTTTQILDKIKDSVAPLPSQKAYMKNLATVLAIHISRNLLIDDGHLERIKLLWEIDHNATYAAEMNQSYLKKYSDHELWDCSPSQCQQLFFGTGEGSGRREL